MDFKKFKIPNQLNITLVLFLFILNSSLFVIANYYNQFHITLLIGVTFAVLMIPVYSLFHEGMHNVLHSEKKYNDLLSLFLSFLFFTPLHFIRFTHNGHHKRNRSDYEMFDLYYGKHDRLWRTAWYYLIITIYWISLPLSTIFLAIMPTALKRKLLFKSMTIKGMIENVDNKFFPMMRFQAWLILIFQASLLYFINFNFEVYLTLYLIHCFCWSSQNYVNHAFSKRDVHLGAHNYKLPKLIQMLYLNFNFHGVHHQYPTIPWNCLTKLESKLPQKRKSYLLAWARMFKGPIQTYESCPLGMTKVD